MEKLPATFLDRDKVLSFAEYMIGRVQRGKSKYPTTYTFNPLDEAQQECVDIANYAMILHYRIERLKEKLHGLEDKKSKTGGCQ